MLIRLLLYLGFLVLGGFIGNRIDLNKKIHSRLSFIQSLCLLFLLFIMGIKIGIDENIIESFFSIGFKAVIIGIFSISFSILGIYIVRKTIFEK